MAVRRVIIYIFREESAEGCACSSTKMTERIKSHWVLNKSIKKLKEMTEIKYKIKM